MAGRDPRETREAVLLGLGCVITSVWVIAVLVQVAFPSRVVPPEVHAVMLVLVPTLFGTAAWQSRRANGNGNGNGNGGWK